MNPPLRRWLIGCLLCVASSLASIEWLDRPAAIFLQPLRTTTVWYWSDRAFTFLLMAVVLAVLFPVVCGVCMAARARLPHWTAVPLLCSWSVLLGLGAEAVLKSIFGRTSPPAFFHEHLYRFNILHGVMIRDAFPSGTAIISVAIASVLWFTMPRLRIIAPGLAATWCVVVVVLTYHWVADVIAGAYLGWSIGWFTVLLLRATRPGETRQAE